MKSAITIILAAALFSFGHAQVASLLDQSKDDAAFLESGFQGECYSLKYGSVELKGAQSEMTTEDLKAMLSGSYAIMAAEGCAEAGAIEHMELEFDYTSGANYTMTYEQLNELQSADIGERLIVNLIKVTVKSVRFKDAAGALQSLPAHVITIK